MNIRELFEDPSKLNVETLPELKALVERYPFFQAARLLYISNLYRLHSQDFGAELRKAREGESERTISLIDRFLQEGGIETDDDHGPQRETPSLIDLTNDYASYLMQQDSQTLGTSDDASSEAPKLKGADLIDSFIEETKGKQRMDIADIDDEEFESPELSAEDEEIYTESMVNIYIKQGRYQQALEILRKISLNNPKKSSNFAAQIYLLEVLLKENK